MARVAEVNRVEIERTSTDGRVFAADGVMPERASACGRVVFVADHVFMSAPMPMAVFQTPILVFVERSNPTGCRFGEK